MSREEAMKAFIESGMELRRDDIELGKKLERERIIKLLEENSANYPFCKCDTCERERFLIALIKGEQK